MEYFGQWLNIEEYVPQPGQPVLFWHPVYELHLGYFGREGFYRAFNGTIEEFSNITYWMVVPKAPEPSAKVD